MLFYGLIVSFANNIKYFITQTVSFIELFRHFYVWPNFNNIIAYWWQLIKINLMEYFKL